MTLWFGKRLKLFSVKCGLWKKGAKSNMLYSLACREREIELLLRKEKNKVGGVAVCSL